jgi:hypothetical protein
MVRSDRAGARLIEDVGAEPWGSDHPHPDGIWPDSSESYQPTARLTYRPPDPSCRGPGDDVTVMLRENDVTVGHRENAGTLYGLID